MSAASNPKHAAGVAKPSVSKVPTAPLWLAGRVMEVGAGKYGAYNWAEAGVVASVYYDAMRRHLDAWWGGQDDDPETGVSHLAHVIACAAIALDCDLIGNLEDDRPAASTSVARVLDLLAALPKPEPERG